MQIHPSFFQLKKSADSRSSLLDICFINKTLCYNCDVINSAKNTMATIVQSPLFSWHQVESRSDLDRLEFALKCMPDEPLMQELEALRGHGRDDYPVRSMWNAVVAGVVFQHISIESLRRELGRNPALLQCCGFSVLPLSHKPCLQLVASNTDIQKCIYPVVVRDESWLAQQASIELWHRY